MVVLKTGVIYTPPEVDIRTGEWKFRIEGYEPEGKWVGIVFSFKAINRAFLITIFSVESRCRKTGGRHESSDEEGGGKGNLQ